MRRETMDVIPHAAARVRRRVASAANEEDDDDDDWGAGTRE